MYQANTGAYEPPTGKCPDINLILHRYRYIERRSFLEPKQRKEPHSLFTLAFYPVIRLSVWKAYVIIAFTCMLACDFFNKLNMYWYSHWSNPYANHHQYYDIGSKIHKLVELMFAPVRSKSLSTPTIAEFSASTRSYLFYSQRCAYPGNSQRDPVRESRENTRIYERLLGQILIRDKFSSNHKSHSFWVKFKIQRSCQTESRYNTTCSLIHSTNICWMTTVCPLCLHF